MATRRMGSKRLDHGAQFFTVRSEAFGATVEAAIDAGAVHVWCNGFDDPADGYPRYRGTDGMTSLAKWMATDLAVDLGTQIVSLTDHPARAYVLTAPVPQSLAILSFSKLLPEPALAIGLANIAYKPTIAVLVGLAATPSGLPSHGGIQLLGHDRLAFITDNQAKGVSIEPALTIHLTNDYSGELWRVDDQTIVESAVEAAAELIELPVITEVQVQRWRYAGPVQVWPEPTVVWGHDPIVALAGEAFAGPKVEGAFLSGQAAAAELLARL